MPATQQYSHYVRFLKKEGKRAETNFSSPKVVTTNLDKVFKVTMGLLSVMKSTKTACFGIKVIYNIYKDHLRALCY